MEDYQILKFLQGQSSKTERENMLAWLAQSEENRNTYFQLKALWFAYKDNFYNDKENLEKSLSAYLTRVNPSGISRFFTAIYRSISMLFFARQTAFTIKHNRKA